MMSDARKGHDNLRSLNLSEYPIKNIESNKNHDMKSLNHDESRLTHDVISLNHDKSRSTHDVKPLNHDESNSTQDVNSLNHEVKPSNHDKSYTNHDVNYLSHGKSRSNHGVKISVILMVLATTIGTSFGIYNTAVVNNLKPIVVDYLNNTCAGCRVSADHETVWALVVASYPIGEGIGTFLAAFLAEILGRKATLIISAILNAIGGLMCCFYLKVFELSIGGRLIMGVGLGVGMPAASAFITEIAPLKYRGMCNAALQVGFSMGDVVGMVITLPALLGTLSLSKYALGFTLIPSVFTAVVLLFAHESPRYLILKFNKLDRGKKALIFYQGRYKAMEVFEEILSERKGIIANWWLVAPAFCTWLRFISYLTNNHVKAQKLIGTHKSIKKVLLNAPLKQLAIVSGCFAIPVLSGVSMIMGYSTDAFIDNGLSPLISPYFSLSLALCNFASSIACLLLVERLGRRNLMKLGLIGSFVGPLLFTVISLINVHVYQRPFWIPYLLIFSLNIYALFYSFLNTACFALAAEVCSQNFRSYAMAFGNFVAMAGSTLVILTYEPIRRYFGISWVFFPFNFLGSLLGLVLIFTIRETAGVTLTDIKKRFVKK